MKMLGVAFIGAVAFVGMQLAFGIPLWPAVALYALGGFVQVVQGWVRP